MSPGSVEYIPWGHDGMTEEVPDDFFEIEAARARKFFAAFVPAVPKRLEYLDQFMSAFLQRPWTLSEDADALAEVARAILTTAPTRKPTPDEVEADIVRLAEQMNVHRRIVENTVREQSEFASIPLNPVAWNSWHADVGLMMYALAARRVELPPWRLDTKCKIAQRRNQPYIYFNRLYEWWPIDCGKWAVYALGKCQSNMTLQSSIIHQMNEVLDCKRLSAPA